MTDLQIYDIAIDGMRPVTQADVNDFVDLRRIYGKLRARGLVPEEIHAELIEARKQNHPVMIG